MTSLTRIDKDKKIARTKGMIASATAVTAIALGIAAASPILGIMGLIPAAYFAYDWLRFRIDKSLRV